MKGIIFIFLCFGFKMNAGSQPMPDSIKIKYQDAKTSEAKGRLLNDFLVRPTRADSQEVNHAIQLLKWFRMQRDEAGADYMELYLSNVFSFKGDYATALNMAFPVLSRFQQSKDYYGMMRAYHDIGNAYSIAKNFEKASIYSKKSIEFAERVDPRKYLPVVCNDLGVDYSIALMPDSGLIYSQRAVSIDTENKDTIRLCSSLSTVGENYLAAGDYEIALSFLRKAFIFQVYVMGYENNYSLAYAYNDFSQAYSGLKKYDSAIFYAQQAVKVSETMGYKDQLLRAYSSLYKSFNETKMRDSLTKYVLLAMMAKDSLYSMEKTRNIEAVNFREELHQQQIDADNLKAQEERRQNIQYALIALGIIIFITLFLLLSRTVIVNERLISFFAILGLLVVFEYINLLIHPWLAHFTHESPVLMLLALVCIAALLIPFHHKLEHWIKGKMIEKNKAIRLAAAKKTIEKLEGEKNQTDQHV